MLKAPLEGDIDDCFIPLDRAPVRINGKSSARGGARSDDSHPRRAVRRLLAVRAAGMESYPDCPMTAFVEGTRRWFHGGGPPDDHMRRRVRKYTPARAMAAVRANTPH
ncbi:hypothetical protein Acidovoranil_16140 [Acidovorax sp. FG27]